MPNVAPNKEEELICPFCNREVDLTFHHFIPKKVHGRKYYKKHYSKQDLNQGINICALCHKGIHRLYDETTLAKRLNNADVLLDDEALAKHFKWVSKQKFAR